MPQWLVYIIEGFFAIALFVNGALFIPQAVKIAKNKTAKNISLLTFAGFFATQLLTILHAIIKHDLVLLIGYTFALLTCGSVVLLILKYRKK